MALYVYGIARAQDALEAAAGSTELDVVEHGEIAALVRQLPEGGLRLRGDMVHAHANVLREAFERGPVLPMRFGTTIPDAEAIVGELLGPRIDLLKRRLDALAGKAEMQIKATYQEEPLLRSILENDPALRRSVDRSRHLPAAATHFEQIRIGEAIAGAVEVRRAGDGEALLGELRPLALGMIVSAPHHERAVLNAAFLIDSNDLDRFDATVQRLSDERPGMEFRLIGPLPAYSFADRELELLGVAETPA
jgi:hypothetical protein